MKHCPACKKTLTLCHFNNNKHAHDGKQNYCRSCHAPIMRARTKLSGRVSKDRYGYYTGVTYAWRKDGVILRGGQCMIAPYQRKHNIDYKHLRDIGAEFIVINKIKCTRARELRKKLDFLERMFILMHDPIYNKAPGGGTARSDAERDEDSATYLPPLMWQTIM